MNSSLQEGKKKRGHPGISTTSQERCKRGGGEVGAEITEWIREDREGRSIRGGKVSMG